MRIWEMTARRRRVAFSEVDMHSCRLGVGSAIGIIYNQYKRTRFIATARKCAAKCVLCESDSVFLRPIAGTTELERAFGIPYIIASSYFTS